MHQALVGPPWALMGRALVAPMGHALVDPLALMGRALMGPPGPLCAWPCGPPCGSPWAGPLWAAGLPWASMGWAIVGPLGPWSRDALVEVALKIKLAPPKHILRYNTSI